MRTALPSWPVPVVLAAPSGTGKTTIAHALVDRFEDFVFSVSVTTRPPRAGERDGVDYEFVERAEFDRLVADGELVEWAEVHGNFYGTPHRNLEAVQVAGKHPILDIDVQGARQIQARIPEALLFFIFPPSGEALLRRLSGRGTEGSVELARRLRAAHTELEAAAQFDYMVVNDDLDAAVAAIRGIVLADRHRPRRAMDFRGEVARIRSEIDAFPESGGAQGGGGG